MTLHDRRRVLRANVSQEAAAALRPMTAHATKFLSVKEVATVMHVSVATVWRYAQRGTLPEPIRIDGHTWWIETEVLAVIEQKMATRQTHINASSLPAPASKTKRFRVHLDRSGLRRAAL
ncbi:AlpA family transcriptional regulator [Mesorhizobium sp. LSHC412B00]|uniref:helix-turn-helix transcriptional regulator n=1 Tax=Mesorhizobium sp. LSHC412B00 TaxID=1287285 RepID=UPI0003CE0DE1|nr:helix-turn-helix domain-containing protein [Mesorhizobium sp. LSHC412B00]ESX88310.1 DNA-binding protein [Mesorhizobium sp. LSHC412B00]